MWPFQSMFLLPAAILGSEKCQISIIYSQTKSKCLISENHSSKQIHVHFNTQIIQQINSFDRNSDMVAAILDFDEILSFKIVQSDQ